MVDFKTYERAYNDLAAIIDSTEHEEKARALLLGLTNNWSISRPLIRGFFHKASMAKGHQTEEMQEGLSRFLELLTRMQYLFGRTLQKIEANPRFIDLRPTMNDVVRDIEQDLEEFAEIPDFV